MNKVYNWRKIAKYAETHTVRECQARFGFASQTWTNAVNRGDIKPRIKKFPLEQVTKANSTYPRHRLKQRIIDEQLIPYICAICSNKGNWLDKKLVLQLDHKNGISNDNRLENLRFLCPNCHSQTETFSGRHNRRTET